MKSNNYLKLMLTVGTFAAAGLGACAGQPVPQCQVSTPWWTTFTPVSGGNCNLTSHNIGVQTYSDPLNPDFFRIGLRSAQMTNPTYGGLRRTDPSPDAVAKPSVTTEMTPFPDDNFICTNTLPFPAAEANYREETLPDGGVVPALTVKYEWSNVKVLSSAASPGQAFTADLNYTRGACTGSYKAVGIWPPQTGCYTDADCSAVPLPNAVICHGDTDEELLACPDDQITDGLRQVKGSGFNPDFDVKCDKDYGICVFRTLPAGLN